jgi:hypothetical protein
VAIINIENAHSGGLMGIIIGVVFFLLPLAIAIFVIRNAMRARRRDARPWDGKSPPSFGQMRQMAKSMPSPDAIYAMSFPDIAPLFKPEQLLQWQAWYLERRNSGQLLRDGRRWHGEVPGFPDAATMAVTAQGKEEASPDLVVLQNQAGQTLVEMIVDSRSV